MSLEAYRADGSSTSESSCKASRNCEVATLDGSIAEHHACRFCECHVFENRFDNAGMCREYKP